MLIREHVNGWIGQIDPGDVQGKWHVEAYPTDGDVPPPPVRGYVLGQREAMRLADRLVQDHASHACGECGSWRRPDEQRLSAGVQLDTSVDGCVVESA